MAQDSNPRKIEPQIAVALIGAVAVIIAALLALVPYFFPRSAPSTPLAGIVTDTPVAPATRAVSFDVTRLPTTQTANTANFPTAVPGSGTCFDQLVNGVIPQTIGIGRSFEDFPYASTARPAPFVVILTERGAVVGAIHVSVDTNERMTYVENVYDARCALTDTWKNRDNPQGDRHILDDNHTMALSFAGSNYEVTFQIKDDALRVNNPRRVE